MNKKYINKTTEKKIELLFEFSKSELFENGITNFNLQKVISYSRLSKSTFYKRFESKNNFIKIIIKNLMDDLITPFINYLDKFDTFEDILKMLSNLNFDIISILNEYPVEDLFKYPEVTKFINQYYYDTFGIIIEKKIKDFQNRKEIRDDISAEYIFEFLTSITKGMGLMLKEKNFKDVVFNYNKLLFSALKMTDLND